MIDHPYPDGTRITGQHGDGTIKGVVYLQDRLAYYVQWDEWRTLTDGRLAKWRDTVVASAVCPEAVLWSAA